jgi:hypothetical protein
VVHLSTVVLSAASNSVVLSCAPVAVSTHTSLPGLLDITGISASLVNSTQGKVWTRIR